MPTEFEKLLDSICFKHYYYRQKKKTDSCEAKWGILRNGILPYLLVFC